MTRVKLLTILCAVAAPIWVVGQTSNFMGGTPSSVDATKVRTTRLKFPKASRSNWHSHTWGQLLMLEEGHGRTQVRGGPVLETAPGEDALQLTIYEGDVKWLEPVTDQQYMTAPKK